jgi:hypothetical protein
MRDDPLELLNFVANQPEVLQEVAPGYAWVDLEKFFRNPNNKMFGDDRGVVIFAQIAGGAYEMHYLFSDAVRGRRAMLVARNAMEKMFTSHGATSIGGAVPRTHLPARVMTRALGFRPIGTTTDLAGRPCIVYKLERGEWASFSKVLLAESAASSAAECKPAQTSKRRSKRSRATIT